METNTEGTITLLDGSVIKGYAPQSLTEERNAPVKQEEGTEEEEESGRDRIIFFLNHAFFLLSHAREILSDSRMFLAPVPVIGGLAYMGNSGFRRPTLGIYLEWLARCDDALVEYNGQKWLLWFISGSPLTGSSACSVVNDKGEICTYRWLSFSHVYSSFVKINKRYEEAKDKYACYTLKEVVNILKRDYDDKDKQQLTLDSYFRNKDFRALTKKLNSEEEQCKTLREELVTTKIFFEYDRYAELYRRFSEAENEYHQKREELLAKRKELRKRLRSGELKSKEYQDLVHPVNVELSKLSNPISWYYWNSETKDKFVSIKDVKDFFLKEGENK